MSYASVAEFKAGIPERDLVNLTDLAVDATGEVQDARIQEALDDASSEIDSYIAKRVTVPMNPVPRILKVVCRDLALHRLYVNIGHSMDARKSLRDDAIGYLKSVARGDAALGDGGDIAPTVTSPGVAMTEGPERQLTRDRLTGF
jgi:phage gp36-like protein